MKDLKKDAKKRGTFLIKPDEEEYAVWAKENGSSDLQIEEGLKQRRLAIEQIDTDVDVGGEEEGVVDTEDIPFGGMSKKEVLQDAYRRGITDLKEIEKVGSLYDLLVGEEDEMEDVSEEDIAALPLEKQEKLKKQVKKAAVTKAQALESVDERGGVMESIGTMETGQEIIKALESGVTTGKVEGAWREGVFGVGARAFGLTSKEEDNLVAKMNVFTARFIKSISGAQVSDEERKFLLQALPSESKTKQANVEGIKAISDYLTNRYSQTIGVDLTPLQPRESANNASDPLKLTDKTKSKKNPLGI